jgi:hypothetical protein
MVMTALVLAAAAAGHACGKSVDDDDFVLEWDLSPSPPRVGDSRMTISLLDRAGSPIDGATVVLEGNMTHPGMQPVVAPAREIELGRFSADLRFVMAGDWTVLVTVTLPNGDVVQRAIELRDVRTH